MKKILVLFIMLVLSGSLFAQYQQINNGESGLSVRTKLNTMHNQLYNLHLTAQFSSDGASWHADYAGGDYYMRLSSDLGTTWTAKVLIFDGINILDSLNMNNTRIKGLSAGIASTDAVNLQQLNDSINVADAQTLALDSTNNTMGITISNGNRVAFDILGVLSSDATITGLGTVASPAKVDSSVMSTKAYVDAQVIASSGYNDEAAMDAIGAALKSSGDVTFTYSDVGDSIIGDVKDDSHNHIIANTDNLSDSLLAKQNLITGAATTVVSSNLAGSMALESNSSGKIIVSSTISATELSYLNNAASNIQTQITLNKDSIDVHTDSIASLSTQVYKNVDSLAVHLDTLQSHNTRININVDSIGVHTDSIAGLSTRKMEKSVYDANSDGIINPTAGGTGQAAVATGDLLIGYTTNTWSRLSAGESGTVLTSNGTTSYPTWETPAFNANLAIDTLTGTRDTLNVSLSWHGIHTMGSATDTIFIDNLVAGMTGNIEINCRASADSLLFLSDSTIWVNPSLDAVNKKIPVTNSATGNDTFSYWFTGGKVKINGTKNYE